MIIFTLLYLRLFNPVTASSWKSSRRASAIHHAASVTNVIRWICRGDLLLELFGFLRSDQQRKPWEKKKASRVINDIHLTGVKTRASGQLRGSSS